MGLSQEAFAKQLGVSRNYVSMIEGGREPSAAILRLLDIIEEQRNAGNSGPRSQLRLAREARGLSVAELAKLVGYSVATYQEIENGRSQMGEKMVAKVAKVLGLSKEELMDGGDHPPERGVERGTFGTVPELRMGPGMEKSRVKFVPLLSMAQCGTMHAYDDSAYAHDGFIAFNCNDPKAFALTLAGDSMQPRYDPGDVAVVYPSFPPRNGDLVIARLLDDEGGDVMFKVYQPNGERVSLISYNPVYPPLDLARSSFQWIYPVSSVTKVLRQS